MALHVLRIGDKRRVAIALQAAHETRATCGLAPRRLIAQPSHEDRPCC